jgi:hypothetical protein
MVTDAAIALGAFAAATAAAALLGAANMGTAFGVGQVAFAASVSYLLLRR